MAQEGNLYAELYDYSVLEAAYEAAFLYLADPPEAEEEWLINLQNHLIWRSYEPAADPDMDCVVLTAIDRLLKSHGLKAREVQDPDLRRILTDLTQE